LRFIFFSLLILNIALAIWVFLVPKGPEPTAPIPVAGDSVQNMRTKQQQPAAAAPEPMQNPSEDTPAVVEESPQVDENLCALVGPYTNLAQADILVEKLAGLEVSAVLNTVAVPVKKNYWVYLPPMETKADSFKKLAELQAQEIDSFIIRNGELANGISLGLFNERDRAETSKQKFLDLGYPVAIHEDIRTAEQYWVIAKARDAVTVSQDTWSQLLEASDEVSYQQNYCPDVASSQ